MTSDFIALVLQATGGAIADTADTSKGSDQGTHIMVGGLAFQVLSLLLFMALTLEFSWSVRRDQKDALRLDHRIENVGFNGKTGRAFNTFIDGRSNLEPQDISSLTRMKRYL
jgi:hypothetical protein